MDFGYPQILDPDLLKMYITQGKIGSKEETNIEKLKQITIQANAERQGANAWQNLKAAHPEHADALDQLSAIELMSADYLDSMLAEEAKLLAG